MLRIVKSRSLKNVLEAVGPRATGFTAPLFWLVAIFLQTAIPCESRVPHGVAVGCCPPLKGHKGEAVPDL